MVTWRDVVVAIPTVQPARAASLAALLRQVTASCHGALVLVHPHVPGDPPKWDFPRLLTAAARVGRPWILQLEDDAHLAPTFGEDALAHGLDQADLVSLFSRRKEDYDAYMRGAMLKRRSPRAFCGNVGFFLRSPVAEGLEAFAPGFFQRNPQHIHAADLLLADYLAVQKARVLVRLPSMVQHLGIQTTLSRRGGARQSSMYTHAFGAVPQMPDNAGP